MELLDSEQSAGLIKFYAKAYQLANRLHFCSLFVASNTIRLKFKTTAF
jgi:hypothetical protein